MGLVHTELQLSNAREPRLAPIVVSALADSGALHLRVPAHVALQLDLEELERREVTLADGARDLLPYVGPLMVRFGNRTCFTGAMVLGEEVLLGAIPMEDMDLVVGPSKRDVIANPASPNIPASIAKGVRLGTGRASYAQSRSSITTSETNTSQRGTGRAGILRRSSH